MKPKDDNIYNQHIVLNRLYGDYKEITSNSIVKFKIGNDVRISKLKMSLPKVIKVIGAMKYLLL